MTDSILRLAEREVQTWSPLKFYIFIHLACLRRLIIKDGRVTAVYYGNSIPPINAMNARLGRLARVAIYEQVIHQAIHQANQGFGGARSPNKPDLSTTPPYLAFTLE